MTAVVPYDQKFDIDIGRSGSAGLGNPHAVGRCFRCGLTHSREEAIALYRSYLFTLVDIDQNFRRKVLNCRGKRLGCPGRCRPEKPCHGDVIVEWLELHSEEV